MFYRKLHLKPQTILELKYALQLIWSAFPDMPSLTHLASDSRIVLL